MPKVADPPAAMVCDTGVTVRFVGLDSSDTVPLPPPVNVIVTDAEAPFFWIDMELGLIAGKHGTGVGLGVGDGSGVGD